METFYKRLIHDICLLINQKQYKRAVTIIIIFR
jgi:hypothetical protein